MSQKKEVRSWKKVYENDLPYVVSELKEAISNARPSMIILTGELGVGKTSFAKAFATDGTLQSPTYSVLSETMTVAHADFYRIADVSEVIHLELGLYLESKEFFLVEWGAKYLGSLFREVDEKFTPFELVIEINSKKNAPNKDANGAEIPSRDYFLYKVDRSSY
ncbi:MAG: tRNA (adenosine(37)-N6)-threonylcarbamoyltransferase complex ATPase subunit type 1 TsaE [Oligoflexia bacterium]|nr:tRNA (adenosine(37)-N6)-threonylcarbamoyltransferase complex ATPase subunit type 1 TsaE [Oligoflexia bacterium]